MFSHLTDSITNIPGIGPNTAQKLKKLGIYIVSDLIHYYPRGWDDFSNIVDITSIVDGEKNTIKAELISINQFISPYKRMYITNALFKDDSGSLKVTWFNQPYLIKNLIKHETYLLSGKATKYQGQLALNSPITELADKSPVHSGRIVPIYPLTEGLTSRMLRKNILHLTKTIKSIPDTLPDELIKKYKLSPLSASLVNIHFPASFNILEQSKLRLSLEELAPIQLSILLNKEVWDNHPGKAIKIPANFLANFKSDLKFELTKTQLLAIKQILGDLKQPHPMNRLLMGDVGSGKTIVATAAIIATVKNKYQVALVAPTEILANQHYTNLKPLLDAWNIKSTLITGKTKLNTWAEISNQKIDVIIGTHAIIQKSAKFKNLNLIIIDEQHRFGVRQRQSLKNQNGDFTPHFLSLSATPIPRTLFLGLLEDLNISWLDSLPQGRLPIITKLISDKKQYPAICKLINKEIALNHKVFIIAPLITDSLTSTTKTSVESEKFKMAKLFPNARIALLHGKMNSADKLKIMDQLKNNELDILIATSVIEVGIDISTASVIWIKNAESFGLASLHQMRGRVGRSNIQSFCLIESNSQTPTTIERLEALTKTTNGEKLAKIDLKLRGPGAFFSGQQSGFSKLKLTDLTNIKLIKQSRSLAKDILILDPLLKQFSVFREQVKTNYLTHLE